jgi:Periplasmic copper-binding protein (NosD)
VKLQKGHAIRRSVFALLVLIGMHATQAKAARLIVSNSATPCPGAAYTTIQSAINAASSGDTIVVCAGTYTEQLAITKSLAINAEIGAFLVPPSLTQNATSLETGDAIAAAVFISGAANVAIAGLTVDGINNGVTECAPDVIGVYFQNSSGSLRHDAIRNFKLSASLNGCQSGTGVFVESGSGQSSSVAVEDCSIHDYQKNGITANSSGTNVNISRNVVTGVGPTTGAAQNGIQIGFSAAGTIRGNTVTNNFWSPCTNAATCTAVATAILVAESNGVTVADNTVGIDQVGIFIDGNNATVSNNRAFAASVFENITITGNANQVAGNSVFNGGDADIFVQGNNNTVSLNSITEAPVGILEAAGSTGNSFVANRFFAVGATIQDPVAPDASKRIQPQR